MRPPNGAEILRGFKRAAVLVARSAMRSRKARRLRVLRQARKHRKDHRV
jgi:hypothetical protein